MPFFSIDVEASGPLPGIHDLLSIGLVLVGHDGGKYIPLPDEVYWELLPVHGGVVKEAMNVNRLDLERLKREGLLPSEVALQLDRWVRDRSSPDDPAVFVGYVANFDWSFINDLFLRHNMDNPFGYRALDFRAMAMGLLPKPWMAIKHHELAEECGVKMPSDGEAHHALVDARHQAELFCALLNRMGLRDALRGHRGV